jgi:hypothetical protein
MPWTGREKEKAKRIPDTGQHWVDFPWIGWGCRSEFHGASAANANDDLLGGFVRSPLFSLQWTWSFAASLHCHVADAPRVAGGHVMVQNKQATYQTFRYQYLF